MKNILTRFGAAAVVLLLVIASCKKDKVDNTADLLVGKWPLVKTVVPTDDGPVTITYKNGSYLQFNADGTYNRAVVDEDDDPGKYSYSKKFKKLTFTPDKGEYFEGDILTLTESELVINAFRHVLGGQDTLTMYMKK